MKRYGSLTDLMADNPAQGTRFTDHNGNGYTVTDHIAVSDQGEDIHELFAVLTVS